MLLLIQRFREFAVCWILAVLVFLSFAWPDRSISGPDEASHFATICFYYNQQRMPNAGDSTTILGGQIHQPPLYYTISASALHARDQIVRLVKSFRRPANPSMDRTFKLPLLKHNPKPLHRAVEHLDLVRFLRFFWIPFNALTVVLTLAAGLVIFPKTPAIGRMAAVLHLFLPQFSFISSVINNDHLANLIVAILFLELACLFRSTPVTTATAIRVGVWSALCVWIKLTSLLWVPLLFAALLLRSNSKIKHIVCAGSLMSLLGFPLWIYNYLVWDHPFAFTILHVIHRKLFSPRILSDMSWQFTVKTFLGAFGDRAHLVLMSHQYIIYLVLCCLMLLGFFRSLKGTSTARFSELRWIRFFFLAGITLGVSALIHYGMEMLGGDQGRYLFTSLPPMMLCFAEGTYRLGGHRLGWLVCLILASLWIGMWFYVYFDVYLPVHLS